MLLSKAIDLFQTLLDKYGSAYAEEDEVIDYLNLGINEFLNRLFPDSEGGIVNYEFDAHTVAEIQPLIYTFDVSMNANGLLDNSTINNALVAASFAGAEYFRISSVGFDGIPAKFMKQNSVWVYQINKFKQPTATNPRYTLVAQGLQFYPTSIGATITLSVIKKPKVLDNTMLADELEFDDHAAYNIIALALKFGGVAIRDQELLQDVRLTNLQIAQ